MALVMKNIERPKLDPKKMDIKCCQELIIALGIERSLALRRAYSAWLQHPSPRNLATVRYWEDALKDDLTGLHDEDIAKIRRQVEAEGGCKNYIRAVRPQRNGRPKQQKDDIQDDYTQSHD